MGLAHYLPRYHPEDGCPTCRFHQQFVGSDAREDQEDTTTWQEHRERLRTLRAYARHRPEPWRSRLRSLLNRLEREWPIPPPHRRLNHWPGWTNSSEKS